MARNKRLQDRDEKQKEILDAARGLFLNEGYEATSMTRIASIAGVAPNTIYWYFKDKDELLITILNAELIKGMTEYMQIQEKNLVDRILWVVDQLRLANQLVSTVHARLKCSSVIHVWHTQFHTLVENLLREELKQLGLSTQRIEAKLKIAVFTVEGFLTHEVSMQEKYSICDELFKL